MDKLNQDDLYKAYLRKTFGPNVFPILKIIMTMVAFFLISIIVMINMFIVSNTPRSKNREDACVRQPPPKQTRPIVRVPLD